jgi:hypothetical protein
MHFSKRLLLLIISISIIALIFVGSVVYNMDVPSPMHSLKSISTTSTLSGLPTSTAAGLTPIQTNWQVFQSFSAQGSLRTTAFTLPPHWKGAWTCDPSSFRSGTETYEVIVTLYKADGSSNQLIFNNICSHNNTNGSAEEYIKGDVYFYITSQAKWTLQLQSPQ